MIALVKQVPIEARIVVPFAPLAKLSTHEENLLARSRPHVAEQGAQVGEFLPAIPGHLVDQRPLSINDLVMREREHKILEPRVHESKRQVAVMKSTIDRRVAEIVEGIVHPSHVPLEAKTKTADIERTADSRP